jgi:hypothetical protein
VVARRRTRVTWVDWLKLALIVAIILFPSVFIGLWVAGGEYFGRHVGDTVVNNLPTTTTSTSSS